MVEHKFKETVFGVLGDFDKTLKEPLISTQLNFMPKIFKAT